MSPATISFLAFREGLLAIALFLPWWYTYGTMQRWRSLMKTLRDCGTFLHLTILIRHLFTPLYGYNDWETKAVSVLVRTGHLVCMFVYTAMRTAGHMSMFALWLLLPIIPIVGIVWQTR